MTSAQDRIFNAVDRLFDDQVLFLERLVRFKSLRNEETAAQDFIEAALKERGFDVSRFRTDAAQIGRHPAFSPATVDYGDSWNLVGRRSGAGSGRSLAFNSHVDIVPAGSAQRWASPPFEPRRDGDWLYGRGAGDMKAGLVASIFALDAIAKAGLSLLGDVQVQSVVEEEITGNGAATAFSLGFTADAVVSPEPTDEQLVRANAGVIKFRLETRGRPAHPREPESGQSAIDLMVRLIGHLRILEGKWIAERKNKRWFKDLANPVALTIGTISGGDWIASIPSDCVAEGRIGFYPGDDPKARAKEVEAFIERVQAEDPAFAGERLVTLTWVGVMHAGYELPEGTAAEETLRVAHAATHAAALNTYVMACYLDAAVFSVHGNIPSLVYGPIAENIHGIDERVSLSSLKRVTKALALFTADWCGIAEKA
ncbi:ArgE/DapE family deacylase [Shinella curvata]|uniref:ArgE/DapE family deacylase n=1 Tax=Shinella curvata TaxID=1817964 RepID=A0ABT8XAV4_9HYPH|nr:ArgE/DapE family deacylase [Shinella curvata]MCJ8054737.1 ArgE/DapE family deacylase [Shinella curvata]MDO6120868.1 ArgE/DapE family deacylase [Shinella curvata]